jgi:hypothetical protein
MVKLFLSDAIPILRVKKLIVDVQIRIILRILLFINAVLTVDVILCESWVVYATSSTEFTLRRVKRVGTGEF